ncbi:hypothetical protein BaRGS_00027419 [Batillaria attramentaria]|uniref:Uncharacterized protein n=1 Tax=Batillaria attramentaria TaxID=370345 RepID=A0ABD0K277_9CAEN
MVHINNYLLRNLHVLVKNAKTIDLKHQGKTILPPSGIETVKQQPESALSLIVHIRTCEAMDQTESMDKVQLVCKMRRAGSFCISNKQTRSICDFQAERVKHQKALNRLLKLELMVHEDWGRKPNFPNYSKACRSEVNVVRAVDGLQLYQVNGREWWTVYNCTR